MKRIASLMFLILIPLSYGSEITKKLEGTWSTQINNGNYFTYTETSYLPDGRKCTVFIDYNGEKSTVTYANGGWKIEGNNLIIWTDDTNDKYIPINKPSTDEIIKITNEELHIRPIGHGQTNTEIRYRVFENRAENNCNLAPNKRIK